MEGEGQIKEEMSYILVSQLPKYKQFIGQPLSCHSVKGGLGNLPHRNFISKLGIQRRAIIIIIGGKVKVSRRADRGEKKKKKKKKKKTKSAKTRRRKARTNKAHCRERWLPSPPDSMMVARIEVRCVQFSKGRTSRSACEGEIAHPSPSRYSLLSRQLPLAQRPSQPPHSLSHSPHFLLDSPCWRALE